MMFSGNAVLDEKNLLGKNAGSQKAALLYYTTTVPFSQYLSYSTDGFQRIEKYADAPVIPHIEQENRDPKVVFCDELDCYILALYLKEDIYCIFTSDDLVNWNELQRFHLPGDEECPDVFPLADSKGNRKWIFMGAHGRYLVGNFDNGKFEPEQEAVSLQYGNSAYAAQSFSNLPNGRIVRMAWDRWHLPAHGFRGQMGIPTEMSLSRLENTYYLEARPVEELKTLYNHTRFFENVRVSDDTPFCIPLEDAPYVCQINGLTDAGSKAEIQIFGRTIQLNFQRNEVTIGNNSAPISITGKRCDITILVDRCSIKLFADGGKIYMSCLDDSTLCDRNLPYLVLKADRDTSLESMEIHALNSIWR